MTAKTTKAVKRRSVSRTLINNFDLIAFEKLNIQNMVQNHHLAKSISDASWYQLQMFTNYKAEEYAAEHAGNIEDRDLNTSINIRNRSIEYQKRLLKDIEKRTFTPATGGGACGESNRNSEKQETTSDKGEQSIENTSIQAPPCDRERVTMSLSFRVG